jgi:hypothetical protein
MKTTFATVGFFAVSVLTASACGGGDDDGNGGTSSTAGNGAQAGDSTTGGKSSAGSSGSSGSPGVAGSTSGSAGNGSAGNGSAGSAGSSSGGKCSPGETIPSPLAYPDPLQNCGQEGKGELAGVEGFYRSIKLPKPLAPGDQFSFSVDVSKVSGGTMELWGGDGECGEAHEKLATVTFPLSGGPNPVQCMTAAPKTATFPYLIWVLHGGGNFGDVTLCPDVACP